ncbi:metal-dependent hydrolase [Tepidamorphus sp. 3E244]|uniref:metal-dependent hydrolase n=1 Tax=Tepidamorphus sp. 3E244 TaxID=3385498 RepID=UPI0038FC86C4
MKATWFGHSAVRIETGNAVIIIDPFLSDSSTFEGDPLEAAKGATHVVLTHGHDDHIGDTVSICKETGAQLVANFEICNYLGGKGVENFSPGNHGGRIDCGDFDVAFVQAWHSSSSIVDGTPVYLGNPAGVVILPKASYEPVVLHMGDTDIFSDMKLIADIYKPQVGFVPIGDRFTMGADLAARACRDYFDFKTVIPVHYGTFPIIDQDASKFEKATTGVGAKVLVPKIGEAFDL